MTPSALARLVAVAALLPAPARAAGSGAEDLPALVGTWTYLGGEKNGVELDAEHFEGREVVISDTTFELRREGSGEFDGMSFLMEYELSVGRPVEIDFVVRESPFGEGSTAPGILRVEGDRMWFAYSVWGGERPADFASPENSGIHFFHLERKELEPASLVDDWRLVRGTREGEDIPEDSLETHAVRFTEEQLFLDSGNGMSFTMSYELDTSTTPPTIEMEITESPFGSGVPATGILQQLGDRLILCYTIGSEAPESFTSADLDEHGLLLVLERK